ncbi:hypothetical protein GT347_18945 [Xylophilus rhododendri]|uniref:Exopolysaccharide biosynthesis operon protein EpsL n=1 Tax=Xylophilus rhododendri TaxID=2697032 RepID=A0A857JAX2_9BURK|nr:hypothetical protein [Xylophilus rhododendri]QHI99875.1 hypothetical protein GT347_18945 [Xylophilus rhododendri]
MSPRRAALVCLAAFCVPVGGRATTEIAGQVGTSVQSVDNPFLFPESSADPLKRRDRVQTTDLGVAMRMPLPSDRSFLAVGATASRVVYDALSQLDYTASQFDGLYQWEYGSALRGRLRHREGDSLYNYYGGFFTQREVPHARQDLAEVSLRITPELELPVTATSGSLKYQDAGLAERYNQEEKGLRLALSYTSGRRSTFSAGVRQNEVRFPQRNAADVASIDSAYTDREVFVDTAWRYSDNTIVFGRIGRLDRSFASLSNRDTQLVSLSSGVEWRYSPKTYLSLRGYRQPQTNGQADLRLYVISTGIEGRVLYDMTAKTRISLTGGYEQQKYQSFSNTAAAATGGTDKVMRVSARVEYSPTQHTLVRLEGLRERYSPDPAVSTTGDFTRSSLQLGLSYTFENMQGANRARTQLDAMRYDRVQ